MEENKPQPPSGGTPEPRPRVIDFKAKPGTGSPQGAVPSPTHPQTARPEPARGSDAPARADRPATTPGHSDFEKAPPLRLHGGALPWLLALMGWTLLIGIYDLDGGAAFEGTDCWVGQTAREMKERIDAKDSGIEAWLTPYFSGELRLQKSPGPYWAVILTSYIRGTDVDEVATRLPNSFFAVGIVGVVFWLTRRIAGVRPAVFAGFVAATTPMVLQWSHRGAADLGMTFFTTLSLACLWVGVADEGPGRRRNWYLLAAYLAAGFCMLYKMPMPLVTIGIPALGSLLLQNRWRALANPIHLLGLILFLLPWLPWVIYIYMNQGDIAPMKWRVEYIDRMTGDLPNVEANKETIFYVFYLGVAFVYCLPYAMSLPAALARTVRNTSGVSSDGKLFMLIWFVLLLLFFTASTGKETRYFLPALPPLFVLLGIELSHFFDPHRKGSRVLARLGAFAVWIFVPLAVIGGAYYMKGTEPGEIPFIEKTFPGYHGINSAFEWEALAVPYVVLGLILTVGLSISAALFLRGTRNASFAALVLTVWITFMWAWSRVAPVVQGQRANMSFAQQLSKELDKKYHDNMYQVAQQNPTIIWHSDVRFPRVLDQLKLLRDQGGVRDLDKETKMVLEEIVRKLKGEDLALFVITREYWNIRPYLMEYLEGEEFPETHLWIQSDEGTIKNQTLLIGNQPPPWPEPRLRQPDRRDEPLTKPGTNEPIEAANAA